MLFASYIILVDDVIVSESLETIGQEISLGNIYIYIVALIYNYITLIWL